MSHAAAIIVHYHCYYFIQKLKVEKRKGAGQGREKKREEKRGYIFLFWFTVYST